MEQTEKYTQAMKLLKELNCPEHIITPKVHSCLSSAYYGIIPAKRTAGRKLNEYEGNPNHKQEDDDSYLSRVQAGEIVWQDESKKYGDASRTECPWVQSCPC